MAFKILSYIQNLGSPIGNIKPFYIESLPDADVVYICGAAYFPPPKNQQVVLIDEDVQCFKHLPEELQNHPNVHLHFAGGDWNGLIDLLSKQYPMEKVVVEGPLASRYRNRILEKSFLARQLHHEEIYKFQLFRNLYANFKRLSKAFMVHEKKNALANIPAVICGAGPSLSDVADDLKDFGGAIFAGGSAVSALGKIGISPHFAVAFDPNPEELQRLSGRLDEKIPLLYGHRVLPEIFKLFSGPIGYVRSLTGGIVETWVEEQVGLRGVSPMEKLSYEALSVTTSSIAIAQYLGCNPIMLAGVDLAYTGGKRYAAGVVSGDENGINEEVIRKNGVLTTRRWLLESKAISKFARACPKQKFYTITKKGLGFSALKYRSLKSLKLGNYSIPEICGPSYFDPTDALKRLEESVHKLIGVIEEFQKSQLVEMNMVGNEDKHADLCLLSSGSPAVVIDLRLRGKEEEKWPFLLDMLKEIAKVFSHG